MWASSESNLGKIRNIIEDQKLNKNEVLLAEVDISQMADFMDGYHHQALIEYSPQEELTVTLLDASSNAAQR